MEAEMAERFLRESEAAEILGTTSATLASYRHQKKGPPFTKWGTVGVRYPLTKLLAYMEERTIDPAGR